ncbi:MAG: hypothetical protein GXP06_12245 [Alphaproteobacteria bacterium]|nr:hypothetical protein [Alphaproteobacteria bacterium]
MKLNWIVIIGGVIMIAATFTVAFLEGANAAAETAARTTVASQHTDT